MTVIQRFLKHMQERYQRDSLAIWSLDQTDIRPYSDDFTEGEQAFFNEVGMKLAQGYSAGTYSFDFCDGVVNAMYVPLLKNATGDPQPPWPDLFYDVFLAFDSGEYTRVGDDAAVDPVKAYTDPYIDWILANYSTAQQPSPPRRTAES